LNVARGPAIPHADEPTGHALNGAVGIARMRIASPSDKLGQQRVNKMAPSTPISESIDLLSAAALRTHAKARELGGNRF
jgi:hypothetical protein